MVLKVFQPHNKNFCVWSNGHSGRSTESSSTEGGGVVGRTRTLHGFIARLSEGSLQGERGRLGPPWSLTGGADRELWRLVWNKSTLIVFLVYRNMLQLEKVSTDSICTRLYIFLSLCILQCFTVFLIHKFMSL